MSEIITILDHIRKAINTENIWHCIIGENHYTIKENSLTVELFEKNNEMIILLAQFLPKGLAYTHISLSDPKCFEKLEKCVNSKTTYDTIKNYDKYIELGIAL